MKSLQGHLLIAAPQFVGSPVPRAVVLVTEHDDGKATGVVLNHPLNEQILRSCLEMWQAGKTPVAALKLIQPQIPGVENLLDAMQEDGEHPELKEHCGKQDHCSGKKRGVSQPAVDDAAATEEDGSSSEVEAAGHEAEVSPASGSTEAALSGVPSELSVPPQVMQVPIGVLMAPTETMGGRLGKKVPPLFRVVVGQVGWDNDVLDQELSQGHWFTLPATPDMLFAAHDDLWNFAVRRVGQSVLHNALGLSSDLQPELN